MLYVQKLRLLRKPDPIAPVTPKHAVNLGLVPEEHADAAREAA